ncbi:ptk9 tyrosine kinase 9 [Trichoderma arundinaceum]|uniref:Ptk9 tyrosine kinase 9 n=1 Tax=Trichoderma arundinaceum TaxID=490622 RepID=A0A395NGE4_TRIAR|nr:ptk9 tyrosine kinase 9 [Trichoderma arundinaceum]
MQSGIAASEELQKAFSSLLATPSDFALLVTIQRESLVPVETIAGKSSDFGQNLSVLEPFIKPDVALYVILRRYEDTPRFVAVTYVPDTANVRQKMLFAATRLTLVRELGTEHFRETPFMTMAHELTEKGFKAHDAHNALEAPLTEEEKTLGEVKRAEQEAGSGTAIREIHLSQSLKMPVNEDAIAAMKKIAEGQSTVATLLETAANRGRLQKINAATERVELAPESLNPSSIGELIKSISTVEPRFTFYRFTHTHDGTEQTPVLFFYTCPATAGNKAIKSRMLYPLMKRAVLTIAEQEAGITLEKKFEVEDPSEITEQDVLNDLHPKPVTSSGFSRPKRPGR